MCQLLGMNCATPTDFTFSFRGFCRRGGETGKHEHGWGMAIYEGHGVRTFTDTLPAARSKVAAFVESYPIKTLNTMAHIRYATHGRVSLENVHPFQREMWGIIWTFAHNGEVPKYSNKPYHEHPLLGRLTNRNEVFYHPVGDTDSEATFCAILNALRAEFAELPTLPVLYETLQRLCAQIVEGDEELTILNFLLGCGPYTLFAYSWPGSRPGSSIWNGLFYIIRKPPFSKARLVDVDYSVDFAQVTSPSDRVAVIATAPLTVDEEWKEFRRGELLMFDNGLSYSELYDCLAIEKQGRGLYSKVMPKQQSQESCHGDNYYDLPTQLRKLLQESVDNNSNRNICCYARAADLGCGAGCSGLAFRSCCRHLTGVDLSPAMLEKAREVGCYDELILGDIESILQTRENRNGALFEKETEEPDSTGFDLVFACNVFVYIQDLRPVFQSARECLNGNGVFAFSAELLEDKDESDEPGKTYVLQSCARYAHRRRYIENLVADLGFQTLAFKRSALRKHEGRNVDGVLAIITIQGSA